MPLGFPQAILKDGTVLLNLPEVAAGSRKEEQRRTEDNIEAVAGPRGSFVTATVYGLGYMPFTPNQIPPLRASRQHSITQKEFILNSEDVSSRAESTLTDLDQSQAL